MPIYAKCTLGPQESPNNKINVEIITQISDSPFGRFRVRDLHTGHIFDVWHTALTLLWLDPPKPKQES